MKFSKYQHIERLDTDHVQGILDGECYIFPKIDGCNCQVWQEIINGKGIIIAGSRNRQLTLEEDHEGFYKYISEQEKIQNFFIDHPDVKLYGEYLTPHTVKHYRAEAWLKFYIFDVVYDIDDETQCYSYEDYSKLLDDYGLEYIPCVGKIKNPRPEDLHKLLDTNTYLMQDDKGPGEGLVIKNYGYRNRAGKQIWAKLVRNEFKDRHTKESKVRELNAPLYIENKIVEQYLTNHLIEKVYAKILTEVKDWQKNCIPRFLSTVWHDLINEEMWEIIKQHRNPTINFKELSRLVVSKIKEIKPDVFEQIKKEEKDGTNN